MKDRKAQSLQRVLEIAAEIFAHRTFDSVSVTEIAEAAHCSTATIYEVYRNKENLFLQAISHLLHTRRAPRLNRLDSGQSLDTVLTYTEARARYLASREQRNVFRSLAIRLESVECMFEDLMKEERRYVEGVLFAETRANLAAGLFRPLPVDVIVHNIMAGTTYEPVVYGFVYGDDTPVSFTNLIRRVFTPLVSLAGQKQLVAYLVRGGCLGSDLDADQAIGRAAS